MSRNAWQNAAEADAWLRQTIRIRKSPVDLQADVQRMSDLLADEVERGEQVFICAAGGRGGLGPNF